MTTYHRNGRKATIETVLQYIRDHPGCNAFDIAGALGLAVQTVRNHTLLLEGSEHVTHTLVAHNKARTYAFYPAGDESLIVSDGRNLPVERKTAKKRQRVEWVNPYHGLPLNERLAKIQQAAIENGTCYQIATLAPSGRLTAPGA